MSRPANRSGYLRPRFVPHLWSWLVVGPWRYTYRSARRDGVGVRRAARMGWRDLRAGVRQLPLVVREWKSWGRR